MSEVGGIYQQIALWSQVVGALTFLALLVYLFRRFIVPAVIASQERKNAELAEAERRRDAAKAEVEAAKVALAATQSESLQIRERAALDARRDHERALAEAKTEGERLLRNAQGELERARVAARETLRAELLEKALAIARQSAAQRIDADRNGQLVAGVMDSIHNGSETVHA